MDSGDASAQIAGHGMTLEAFGSTCRVVQSTEQGKRTELGALRLRVPGRHNLLNALAAVAVGLETGVPFPRIASALEQFAAPSAVFSAVGKSAASWSSTTTAITRPRSRQ